MYGVLGTAGSTILMVGGLAYDKAEMELFGPILSRVEFGQYTTQGGIHYVGDTRHIKCTQDELSTYSTNASGSALEYTGGVGGSLDLGPESSSKFQVQEDQCEGRTL